MSTTAKAGRRHELGPLFGYAVAFGAALAYGSSQVLVRHSVTDLAPPLVGSLISLAAGTLGFLPLTRRQPVEGQNWVKGALLFAGAGFFSTLGLALMFTSLSRAEVVVISPVLATSPLFTVLLAAVFLRGIERLTIHVIVGAALVVVGVVVLSLG